MVRGRPGVCVVVEGTGSAGRNDAKHRISSLNVSSAEPSPGGGTRASETPGRAALPCPTACERCETGWAHRVCLLGLRCPRVLAVLVLAQCMALDAGTAQWKLPGGPVVHGHARRHCAAHPDAWRRLRLLVQVAHTYSTGSCPALPAHARRSAVQRLAPVLGPPQKHCHGGNQGRQRHAQPATPQGCAAWNTATGYKAQRRGNWAFSRSIKPERGGIAAPRTQHDTSPGRENSANPSLPACAACFLLHSSCAAAATSDSCRPPSCSRHAGWTGSHATLSS